MPIYFMTTALLVVTLVTNLTVEGIKKLLNETNKAYSSNVLAAITSVIVQTVDKPQTTRTIRPGFSMVVFSFS